MRTPESARYTPVAQHTGSHVVDKPRALHTCEPPSNSDAARDPNEMMLKRHPTVIDRRHVCSRKPGTTFSAFYLYIAPTCNALFAEVIREPPMLPLRLNFSTCSRLARGCVYGGGAPTFDPQ